MKTKGTRKRQGDTAKKAAHGSRLILFGLIGGLFGGVVTAIAVPSSAESNITTVDTRGITTCTITGTVLANGSPLPGAVIGVDTTAFTANTLNDGTFVLTNVPVGNGYVVNVSAAGYGPKRLTSVNVSLGTNNLGNITLAVANGPYQLVPMVPDVNPSITSVEDGGTAYRYYEVLDANGKPQGGVTVSVIVVGGVVIPQASDVSSYWPGEVAGTSDPDGVVRICVPASALGGPGAVGVVQCILSGKVQQQFQAEVMPRQYEQIWKQRLELGGSIGNGVLGVGASAAPESVIQRTIVGGTATTESISRINTEQFEAGPSGGLDVGLSLKTTSGNFSASAGASISGGIFGSIVARTTYSFADPTSTDPGQNAMKLYLDLGNILAGVPGPQQAFYHFVQQNFEPSFLGPYLNSVEGEVEYGVGVDGQAGFELAGGGTVNVPAQSGLSLNATGISGFEQRYGSSSDSATIRGAATTGSANLGPQELSSFVGLGNMEMFNKTWTHQGQGSPYKTERIDKLSLGSGEQIPVPEWQQYDTNTLYGGYPREFTETTKQLNGSQVATYSESVYADEQTFDANFNLALVALGVKFSGESELGAEAVNERGTIWQSHQWPTESYPAITSALFPTQSWQSLIEQWAGNATGPIGQGINQAVTAVVNAGNTVINAGQAQLNVLEGSLSSGASLISCWAYSQVSKLNLPTPLIKASPMGISGGTSSPYLPPDGASNYVYGIGGIYRFASTNTFNGSATLTISYSNEDLAGLNPADFQIYQLPDGTNRWQLVGGTVDTNAQTVTATITNLGTFAIAPPLPSGILQLNPSTNSLPADGTSQMTITVSNVMLNTGMVATQQWLFTATATGLQILNPDCDTNLTGVQVTSTNGTVTLLLQAPSGGTVANVTLASVAGDAYGSTEINLVDTTPPATPTNVVVTAGQSRIWVTWTTNTEPDLAGYRIYYSAGAAGPPWNGTAAVEGSSSPVWITGTNYCLLRGLSLGTNYFVAVSAVDTTGNESPVSPAHEVTTVPMAPMPPTDVAVRFGSDGTNVLMWALSEDDGYNDRDVTNYYIWRAILPGGSYSNIAQVPAGIGVYIEPDPAVAANQTVSYAVSAVVASGLASTQVVATITVPTSVGSTNVVFGPSKLLPNGQFQLTVNGGVLGQNYVLLASTNLVNWTPISGFVDTNPPVTIYDPDATNYPCRFYRIGPKSMAPTMQFGINSVQPLNSNGLDLVLYSLSGLDYEIQASSNLVDWTIITNFITTDSPIYLSIPMQTNTPQQFYRAMMP